MCRRVVPCGRVFPRWASSANPAERRIYDILYKPGSHEVLYHTLQTFVWKIDAKAAINAFCSLARLDTARLVQMAEPGARPARGTGKLDTSLALEAEGGLAKRLDLLLKNREDLRPIHVSNLMWSLAKVAAREPFGSLTEAISKRLVAEVPKLTGRDLATSLWAVAVLVADTPHRQQIDKSLPVFLLQRVGLLAQSKDLKGYDLTQSLWAAAKLANLKVPGMVKLILELVRGALGEATTFECHSISVSLWSIGLTEELHDKEEIQQFAKELAAAGRLLVSSMNSQMLANSAWGAARVQVNDTSFYEALAVAGLERRKTKDFTVMDQHIYNLAWSFVKAEVYNDATRFVCPTLRFLDTMKQRTPKSALRLYEFDADDELPSRIPDLKNTLGAFHFSELFFLFGNEEGPGGNLPMQGGALGFGLGFSKQDVVISKKMSESWGHLLRHEEVPEWPNLTSNLATRFALNVPGNVDHLSKGMIHRLHHCEFFDALKLDIEKDLKPF